jgi:hypothetical protein
MLETTAKTPKNTRAVLLLPVLALMQPALALLVVRMSASVSQDSMHLIQTQITV